MPKKSQINEYSDMLAFLQLLGEVMITKVMTGRGEERPTITCEALGLNWVRNPLAV